MPVRGVGIWRALGQGNLKLYILNQAWPPPSKHSAAAFGQNHAAASDGGLHKCSEQIIRIKVVFFVPCYRTGPINHTIFFKSGISND